MDRIPQENYFVSLYSPIVRENLAKAHSLAVRWFELLLPIRNTQMGSCHGLALICKQIQQAVHCLPNITKRKTFVNDISSML